MGTSAMVIPRSVLGDHHHPLPSGPMRWAHQLGRPQLHSGGVSACTCMGWVVCGRLRGPLLEISAAFSKWMG